MIAVFWNNLNDREKISLVGVCIAALGLIITSFLKPALTKRRILLAIYYLGYLFKRKKFWSAFLLSLTSFTALYFIFNIHLLSEKLNKVYFISSIIFLVAFGLFKLIRGYVLKLLPFFKPYSVSVYGSFLVDESDVVYVSTNTELLNDLIIDLYNRIGLKLFTHSFPLIHFHLERIPKFYFYLNGKAIGKYISKQVEKQNRLATLHFFIEKETQQVTPVINFDKSVLTNTQLVDTAVSSLNILASSKGLPKRDLIEISTKIYFLLFSQIVNYALIDNKEYSKVHYILDESDSLVNQINSDLIQKGLTGIKAIEELLVFWRSYIERYRATVFIEQKEYFGALRHLFNSIRLNPHHPYRDYQSLKQDYTKKYALELLPEMSDTSLQMDLQVDSKENERIAEALARQVEYFDIDFSYSLVREIMHGDSLPEMVDAIQKETNTLSGTSPFIALTKCEILKYIPKGEKKFNALYVDRIPECQKLLQEVLDVDKDFPLIHTKLGTLLMIKGVVYNDKNFIDQGMDEWKKGMHFFSKVGIDIKKNENKDNTENNEKKSC